VGRFLRHSIYKPPIVYGIRWV